MTRSTDQAFEPRPDRVEPETVRLEMKGISKSFGATRALDSVDLRVGASEVHALIGENGAGKSTLMKVLSGAYRPDSGEIFLDGIPYAPRNPLDGRRAGIAMIYQELALARHLSVAENVLLGVEPGPAFLVDWKTLTKRAREALATVGLQSLNESIPVSRLSVGQQQLVEIARAIASGFRVLVLDEPTSSLSEADRARLFSLIRELRDQGHAIIYISHFLEEVQEVGDRFTVLRDGKTVGSGNARETPVSRITALMVGREVQELYPRTSRVSGEPVLTVQELNGRNRLRTASFQLRRGEVLGIAGLVGAGRTDLLRTIFGLEEVRSGEIQVGVHIGPASPTLRWRQKMGFVSEDRKGEGLALSLPVADNLTLTNLAGLGPLGLVLPARQRGAAREWIDHLGIKCEGPAQRLAQLSGGNQQKVALARLLHHDADVLLLDEPTRGIDVGSKADIYRLIDRLASGISGGKPPKAVIMVSSYLPELLGVCDRIAVMCRGKLHPPRPTGQLDEHQIMQEATGSVEQV